MLFAFIDFMLGLLNIALYMTSGTFISALTAGFCFGMGTAMTLDKILNKWGD